MDRCGRKGAASAGLAAFVLLVYLQMSACFVPSQHLRIISCAHEFHKACVDPWLLQHRTCPLCMHNIMGEAEHPSFLVFV